MEEKKRPEILADKIADVLTTTPLTFDPEDDLDVTKVSDIAGINRDEDEDIAENENILSHFRKNNIDFLADVDERYAGKKARRKELDNSDIINRSDDYLISDVDSSSGNDVSESDHQGDSGQDSSEDYASGDEIEDNSEDDEKEDHHQLFKDGGTKSLSEKGHCVRNQMSLWENLLEIRIQLQKCLMAANKMPSHEHLKAIKEKSSSELMSKLNTTKKTVAGVLDKMILLQDILLKQYPETKNLFKNKTENKSLEDDEEIPSDTEDEMIKDDDDSDDECAPAKKRKMNNYGEILGDKYNKYKKYAETVIQKWNDKTRLTSLTKNNSNAYSVIKQIEYALSNKEKIIKKTQIKKSNYEIVGENIEENSEESCEKHYPEIFDDDDFYHQLLRDLIECKSSDITDPIQLGRQWIQLQSLRSKMKKNVDTRATKGRKIRYAVHSKLVNFMAPIESNDGWSEEAKKDLYSSLFGNLHNKGTIICN